MTLSLLEQAVCLCVAVAATAFTMDPGRLAESARAAYVATSNKGVEAAFTAYFVKFGAAPTAADLMRVGYVAEDADRETVEEAVAKMNHRVSLAGM